MEKVESEAKVNTPPLMPAAAAGPEHGPGCTRAQQPRWLCSRQTPGRTCSLQQAPTCSALMCSVLQTDKELEDAITAPAPGAAMAAPAADAPAEEAAKASLDGKTAADVKNSELHVNTHV